MKKIIQICLFTLLTTSVFGQKKMTQELIDEHGTRAFISSKQDVFDAVKKVLQNNEYEIDIENFEKGKITTLKKVTGETGALFTHGIAQYRKNYRQYTVNIESVSSNYTKVVITPKVWIGESDVSTEKVWVIKGMYGEIKLWENIFNSIQERL